METLEPVPAGRALEALRNGVPNGDAVSVLGTWQRDVEDRFEARIADLTTAATEPPPAPGILISGGFGQGKSHLLEYLQHRALSANLMCSRVVVSKETPLHDAGRMFAAAAAAAVLPAGAGEAVVELGERLNPGSRSHLELTAWADDPRSGVSPIFPASLFVHTRLRDDPEIVNQVRAFWSGQPLPIARLREALRQCGGDSRYAVRTVRLRQLARERFAFVARLARGAGLAGWAILIDEVELIGRYGPIQRGRSYAELARWMGGARSQGYPGIVAVAAITDDFDINVLREKGDLDDIGPRLRSRGTDEMLDTARRAETGMRLIRRDAMPLAPPTPAILGEAHDRLRQVHGAAYGWEPPALEIGELSLRRPMRAFVRRWINEWDLRRLHPGATIDTEEDLLHPSYEPLPEIEGPGRS